MKRKTDERENEQKIAKEILDNIMQNIPTNISVDFGSKIITEVFPDGRTEVKKISEDNPEYTFEVKVVYKSDKE